MKRNRVLFALISICAALTAVSASFSIAWYASSTTVRVNTMLVEIDADRQLLLATSQDGEYKNSLKEKDLNPVGGFMPVTSACSSAWLGKEDMPHFYDMSYPHASKGDPSLIDGEKGSYFSQELFIKSDDDVIVGIDPEKSFFQPNFEKNAYYASRKAVEEGYKAGTKEYDEFVEFTIQRLNYVHLAGRVSILVDDQYIVYDPIANETDPVAFAGPLDNDKDRAYDYYRDDDGQSYEVCYGELLPGFSREDLPYQEASAERQYATGEYSAFNADHAVNVHALDVEASDPFFAHEPRLTLKDLDLALEMPAFHFDLNVGERKRIVVSFYLEGWDPDSVNYIMGASFLCNLSLRIIRER